MSLNITAGFTISKIPGFKGISHLHNLNDTAIGQFQGCVLTQSCESGITMTSGCAYVAMCEVLFARALVRKGPSLSYASIDGSGSSAPHRSCQRGSKNLLVTNGFVQSASDFRSFALSHIPTLRSG